MYFVVVDLMCDLQVIIFCPWHCLDLGCIRCIVFQSDAWRIHLGIARLMNAVVKNLRCDLG